MRLTPWFVLAIVASIGGSPDFGSAFAQGPWRVPSFADSSVGDVPDGDDPVVRQAALDALGKFNGSVVVVDTRTGRILSIINQKLALSDGFMPCSTVKIPIALAALSDGIIDETAQEALTDALARSNNEYFANLGRQLGFERVRHYASLYGLGEVAGIAIDGERPGWLTDEEPRRGGVGRMSSYGEGITLTPLQLAALVSAVSNGGTLYYLQYPDSPEEAARLVPRVKRRLDIERWIPEITPGMLGAVEFGTARTADHDPDRPFAGKTGTCTDRNTPTHLGWFGSFNSTGNRRIAVVVMLTGGAEVDGAAASEVAGRVYRGLAEAGYFETEFRFSPAVLVNSGACCSD